MAWADWRDDAGDDAGDDWGPAAPEQGAAFWETVGLCAWPWCLGLGYLGLRLGWWG